MTLSLQIKGLSTLKAKFKKSPEIVIAEMNPTIKQIIFILLAEARKNAPVDLGFLRGAGMETAFGTLKGTLKNKAPYAKAVHDGTAPHFPPIAEITPWANRHGIPPFLVARSIARKGTKAHPFFADAIHDGQKEIDSLFKKALDNIVTKLAK